MAAPSDSDNEEVLSWLPGGYMEETVPAFWGLGTKKIDFENHLLNLWYL